MVKKGPSKYQEQTHQDFTRISETFVDMLRRKNSDKTIIRVS